MGVGPCLDSDPAGCTSPVASLSCISWSALSRDSRTHYILDLSFRIRPSAMRDRFRTIGSAHFKSARPATAYSSKRSLGCPTTSLFLTHGLSRFSTHHERNTRLWPQSSQFTGEEFKL